MPCGIHFSKVWAPHELTDTNYHRIATHVSIRDLLWKLQEAGPFLKQMVTSNEKWIVYDNVVRKRSWKHSSESSQTASKTGLHLKKVMPSIWWNFKSIIYYEMWLSSKRIDYILLASDKISLSNPHKTSRINKSKERWPITIPYVIDYLDKLLSVRWLILNCMYIGPGLFRLPLIPIVAEFYEREIFKNKETVKEHVHWFFANKPRRFMNAE